MERSIVGKKTTTTLTVDDSDSTEISIFDAEKYFNDLTLLEAQKPMVINGGNRVLPAENVAVEPSRFSSASSSTIDGYSSFYRNYRTRSFHSAATPTTSSEASWNSQTGLLSVQPGSMAVSLRNPLSPTDKKSTRSSPASPSPSASFRWLSLRRKSCPCSCKKSVQVKEKPLGKKPENLPPPQTPKTSAEYRLLPHGSQVLRGVSKSSSMAEIRTVSMEKQHTDRNSYHQNWCQTTLRQQRNSRDTRSSFSSSSNDPLRLQVLHENNIDIRGSAMGIRSSFTDQRGGSNSSTTTGFTFPILNVNGGMKLSLPVLKDPVEDPARDSLEVFRPPHDPQKPSTTNTVVSSRKNSDHFPRSDRPNHQVFTFPASPNSRLKNAVDVDDVASDASSDLFEIESFSTQTTTTTTTATATPAAMFLYMRDSMDEATAPSTSSFQALHRLGPSAVIGSLYDQRRSLDEPMTPTMECCYEPSEASIDWSVTTAEGFDRASVANASEADYGDFSAPEVPMPAQEKSRRKSSGNGGLMMSCRCEKAVSVGQPGPRPVKPVGSSLGGYAGDQGRPVGPGMSSSTVTMWAVGHKL